MVRARWLVLATLFVVLLGGCDGGSRPVGAPSAPDASALPGGVVPWVDLPATHPTMPTVRVPPSPDPAVAAAAPACRAGQLTSGDVTGDGAGGTLYFSYEIRTDSGPPCRLQGVPRLTAWRGDHRVAVPFRAARDDSAYRAPVLVSRTRAALLWLGWPEDWCAPPVRTDALRMTLRGRRGAVGLDGLGHSPFCNGIPHSGPQPVLVWPFAPLRRRAAHRVSPYDGVEVTGDLDLAGSPGDVVTFPVTLTAPRDVLLDPCPDFTIELYGPGVSERASYALNCAGVPYRDPRGRPLLPTRRPVSFEMRVVAPSASAGKMLWILGAGSGLDLGGRLIVSGGR